MAPKWAEECALYEEGGAREYLKAALEYEKRSQAKAGWEIAEAVTEAGFRISKTTVNRRLAALSVARKTRTRANSKEFLEKFAEAYLAQNAQGRTEGTESDLSVPAQSLYLANDHVKKVVAYIQEGHLTPLDRDELPPLARRVQVGLELILAVIERGEVISDDWDKAFAEELA